MDMEEPKPKSWKQSHREKWNDYQREYARMKHKTDPNWRKRRVECKNKNIEKKMAENPEKYKEDVREYYRAHHKEYYKNNRDFVLYRAKVNNYKRKLYKTRNDFEDEDAWFLNTLKYCKDDEAVNCVMDEIDGYIEKREAKNHNLKPEILSEDTI